MWKRSRRISNTLEGMLWEAVCCEAMEATWTETIKHSELNPGCTVIFEFNVHRDTHIHTTFFFVALLQSTHANTTLDCAAKVSQEVPSHRRQNKKNAFFVVGFAQIAFCGCSVRKVGPPVLQRETNKYRSPFPFLPSSSTDCRVHPNICINCS